jgi:hypothetical protein
MSSSQIPDTLVSKNHIFQVPVHAFAKCAFEVLLCIDSVGQSMGNTWIKFVVQSSLIAPSLQLWLKLHSV